MHSKSANKFNPLNASSEPSTNSIISINGDDHQGLLVERDDDDDEAGDDDCSSIFTLNLLQQCCSQLRSDLYRLFSKDTAIIVCVMALLFCSGLILLLLCLSTTFTGDGVAMAVEPDSPKAFNSSKASQIVDALCSAWTRGQYAGDFCPILCTERPRNWTLVDYIEGGGKVVLKLRHEGKEIILKMRHPFLKDYDQLVDFDSINEEQFSDMVLDIVNDQLRLDWPRHYKSHLIQKLWPRAKGDNKKALTRAEMRSIWALVQQEEFVNQAILQMSRVMPKLMGVCGHAYRSEYLIPFRMKPYYLNLKAKILVHLMGTLKLFYEFLNEPFQWCDVKFENLGLSADYPKRFVLMDSDMLYTESRLNAILTGQKCQNDSECGLFDCQSRCNVTSGFCTSRTNDNIDVFCNKLITQLFGSFWSKSNKYLAACHQEPVNVTQRLNELRLVWSWTLSDV